VGSEIDATFWSTVPLLLLHFQGTLDSLLELMGAIGDFGIEKMPRIWKSLLVQIGVTGAGWLLLHRLLAKRKFTVK
jgi:hypothetical protein